MTDYTSYPQGHRKAAKGPALRIEAPDFGGLANDVRATAAVAVTAGVRAATRGLTLEMRQMAHAAGLGDRLPNALRDVVYPKAPKTSLRAAGEVVPNGRGAWNIFDAFSRGVTLTPGDGRRFLAIPTANCPREALRRRFGSVSPEALVELFGRPLRIVNVRPNLALMIMDDLVVAKSGKGFRKATKRRKAQGRSVRSIVMFFLIPQATLRQRLDFARLANAWADRIPDLIARAWPESA